MSTPSIEYTSELRNGATSDARGHCWSSARAVRSSATGERARSHRDNDRGQTKPIGMPAVARFSTQRVSRDSLASRPKSAGMASHSSHSSPAAESSELLCHRGSAQRSRLQAT
jgi:hypothetical protein